MPRSPFLYACLGVALLTIGAGLYMSGSPLRARAMRYDQQRLNELQQISYALDQYWNLKSTLPVSLEDLLTTRDQFYLSSIRDPRSGQPYEYRQLTVTSTGNYELCATFETDTKISYPSTLSKPIGQPFWEHPVGRTCFPLRVTIPAAGPNVRPL